MKQLLLKLRRWALYHFFTIATWVLYHDLCEVCNEEIVDSVCDSCDRRICLGCESGYYEDSYLCTVCRAEITPEQEAENRAESARIQDEDSELEDVSWP